MSRYVRVGPYPDEELGSLLTRTMRRVGLGSADFVRWYLDQPRQPISGIENLVPHVAELIGSTPRRVLQDHTLVPYGTAGLPAAESRRLTIDITSGRIPELFRPIGKLGQRWCVTCVRLDIARFGESFWHRCHLLPGVATCTLHGTPLHQLDGHTPTRLIHRTITYCLGEILPHELSAAPVRLSVAPSLMHAVSHLSARTLKGRRSLPLVELSPAKWRKVLGPEFLHFAGCRGTSACQLPQTTARILSLVTERHLTKSRAGIQLELFI